MQASRRLFLALQCHARRNTQSKCDALQQTQMAHTFENECRARTSGSRFALSGRKPGAQRTGGQRGRSGGASPGPGGSLVGEPSSFLPQAEPQATGGKKARWGQSPASRPGTGAGKVFLLHRKVQAEHSSEPRPAGASAENALPAREAVPEGEAGGRGRRPKSPAG